MNAASPETGSPSRTRYDAIIVGGRAAGAATALLLARAGQRVLVLERGRYGSDTLSTHALMRGAVMQLARWGLLSTVQHAGTPAIVRTCFHYDDAVATVPIKARDGVPALFAPRRHILDRIVIDAAITAGADVRYGITVRDLVHDSGRVRGVIAADHDGQELEFRAALVVGADGLRSIVARLVDAPVVAGATHAAAVVYGYWRGLSRDQYAWHWTTNAAVGVIPTNDEETCVFAAVPSSRFAATFRGALHDGYMTVVQRAAPRIADVIRSAPAVPLHGFPGVPGYLRRAWGPGWALVGDAGYFKDPITAHGLTDAFRDAELLARAVLEHGGDDLASYESARDDLSRELLETTDRIAAFAWTADALRVLHERLSDHMKAEVSALRALQPIAGVMA